tara:strand:+ start:506 stop:2509 length:2004 start_codon:yes stop_codon:yes gene_type:complete
MASQTKQFILDKPLDPGTITLRRFLEIRAQAHIASGKAQTDAIGNSIRNNPAFEKLLDAPLIDFLEAGFEHHTANPLFIASQKIQNDAEARVARSGEGDPQGINSRRRLYSHVSAIEENIIHQLNLPENRDLKIRYDNFLPRMTDGVVNPDKPGALAERFRFRHENVGYLKKALLEHLTANPQDEHIVRALFMQIDLGFRPGEVERMPISAYRQPTGRGRFKGRTVPGLFIPPGMTKMGSEINIPMSPDIFAQFKANMLRHRRLIGEGGIDALFIDNEGNPIREGDMTRILKGIEVRAPDGTGLMFDVETGREIYKLPRAYLLRNMQITAAAAQGIDAVTSGEMRGRAYRGKAAQEVGYRGKVPGSNTPEEMMPHARVHAYFRAQLTDALGFPEDAILAPDQDIIGAWIASGGKLDNFSSAVASTPGQLIPVSQQPEVSMTTPYNMDQIGNLQARIIDQPADQLAAPADEPEMTEEDRGNMFRRMLGALKGPEGKAAIAALALKEGLEDNENLDKEAVANFVVQTGLEEAAYFATSRGLQAVGMTAGAANPYALAGSFLMSMVSSTSEAADLTPEQRTLEEGKAAERRAADNTRPGGSGTTLYDYYPAIGTAEGAEKAARMDMFMEPDFGEGSSQDIMERVVNQDSMMQDIDQTPTFKDETPGFMAQ